MDPKGGREGFAIRLPVRISTVEAGRLAVLSYLEPFQLEDRVINRLEVIMEELVSNVVHHASGADTLRIEAEYADQAIGLAIEDNGIAFNPLEVAPPPAFTTLADATLGGQGIPLVKRLSQSVRYDRIDSANRISVVIAAG